eukprot:TRINITY_DN462_c0_g1_i2.p1 TRINITY_DN462_c0_g1~~TRINITY_DN462_c0_g1_i2.p1  ORF type:complete len:745 (-),score=149.19 TRINITY_DN462_c0_g1_i2:626-2719(-)
MCIRDSPLELVQNNIPLFQNEINESDPMKFITPMNIPDIIKSPAGYYSLVNSTVNVHNSADPHGYLIPMIIFLVAILLILIGLVGFLIGRNSSLWGALKEKQDSVKPSPAMTGKPGPDATASTNEGSNTRPPESQFAFSAQVAPAALFFANHEQFRAPHTTRIARDLEYERITPPLNEHPNILALKNSTEVSNGSSSINRKGSESNVESERHFSGVTPAFDANRTQHPLILPRSESTPPVKMMSMADVTKSSGAASDGDEKRGKISEQAVEESKVIFRPEDNDTIKSQELRMKIKNHHNQSILEEKSASTRRPGPSIRDICENGRFEKTYEILQEIGYGSYGNVFLVRNILENLRYAIKTVKFSVDVSENVRKHRYLGEVALLAQLASLKPHDHIVRYYSCWLEEDTNSKRLNNSYTQSVRSEISQPSIHLPTPSNSNLSDIGFTWDVGEASEQIKNEKEPSVTPSDARRNNNNKPSLNASSNSSLKLDVTLHIQMEYCAGATLKEFLLNRQNPSSPTECFIMFYQILDAVDHIHKNRIIHRDLKPGNIFLTKTGQLKIGDFGLAILHSGSTAPEANPVATDAFGTPLYLAPEAEQKLPYDERVDVYALGVILYEIIGFFRTDMERYKSIKDLREKRIITKEIAEAFRCETTLVMRMTEPNPILRPRVRDLKESSEWKQLKKLLKQKDFTPTSDSLS